MHTVLILACLALASAMPNAPHSRREHNTPEPLGNVQDPNGLDVPVEYDDYNPHGFAPIDGSEASHPVNDEAQHEKTLEERTKRSAQPRRGNGGGFGGGNRGHGHQGHGGGYPNSG
eukprot:maker-scaffold1138_size60085-snap-gene-0.9 protein:Tk01999 transcript:maker-scaffold1138_size60085-snap-gene-0.9-mRNA-1 annotation:"Pc13g08900"